MNRSRRDGYSLLALLIALNYFDPCSARKPLAASTAPVEANVTAPTYGLSDLLVTFATDMNNAPMIDITRLWRTGVRAHIIVDQGLDINTLNLLGRPYDESFTVVPSFPGHPAVLRTVLAPLFATEARGLDSFSWLLVGDADTVFLPGSVLALLNSLGLSAEEPHMLSDFLVECDLRNCRQEVCPVCHAPRRVDRRCLPCPDVRRLCPCQLPASCSSPRATGMSALSTECPVQEEVSAYGGAGIIYSVGLMRKLAADPRFYAAEALRTLVYDRPYSDVALAELARLQGYGFTQLPPAPAPAGEVPSSDAARHFSTYSYYNDGRTTRQQMVDLIRVEQGTPGALKRMVSFHVHAGPGLEFGSQVVPPYRSIVRLLTRKAQPHA